MIEGSCHCGSVRFAVYEEPKWLTSCNCSICRRVAALWGHMDPVNVEISAAEGATIDYVQGDKSLDIHTCRTCGCTTHWSSLDQDNNPRMAVNFRMCSDNDMRKFRVRHFDGADSWEFKD